MTQQVIVFKNNLPNLTVLKLFSQDIEVVISKLQQKLKQAPMMFIGMQLIIDLSEFDQEDELVLDTDALVSFLQGEGVNPVAMMTDRASFREVLIKTSLGVLPVLQTKAEPPTVAQQSSAQSIVTEKNTVTKNESQQAHEEPRRTFEEPQPVAKKLENNQIIRHPVRSGQRVYSRGDLTIIGAVSPGAEVIADGSIHVYGKLSGRAIAGAQGDESVAIFCQSLDAELVSIAGNYKQLEDISEEHRHERVQISLDGEKICFSSL